MRILQKIGWMAVMAMALLLKPVGVYAEEPTATQSLGQVRYRVPKDWKHVKQTNLALLVPSDITEEAKMLILVLPDQPLQGDFRKWFETTLKEGLKEGEKVVEQSETTTQKANSGYELLYKTMVIEDGESHRTFRLYLAAHPGKQVAMVACVASSKEVFGKYNSGLSEFLKSLTFTNLSEKQERPSKSESEKPKLTKPTPTQSKPKEMKTTDRMPQWMSGVEGLYVANILASRPNFSGLGYTYANWNEFWLLLPNGRAYFALPEGDWSQFDWNAARQKEPKRCGTYRLVGDTVELDWQGKKVTFRRGEDVIKLGRYWAGQTGNTVFRKVASEDGQKLSGTFSRQSFVDTSSAISSGGVSGRTAFTFTPDGRFAVENFTGFLTGSKDVLDSSSANGDVSVTGRSSANGEGIYRIHNNTLELTFRDGRKERLSFFRYPGEEKSVLSINGKNYLLHK